MFPLVAARFFKVDDGDSSSKRSSPSRHQTSRPSRPPRFAPLRALDLGSLPRDDGPPTELRNKKEKLAFFDPQCTHVGGCLYVGGETVAKSLETLQKSGITHVINCVGYLYQSFYPDKFEYFTLYLQDSPQEDILCVLYDVFDVIRAAALADGRVCIHCSQGVSRSCAFAIAYRMWDENRTYESVFEEVKRMRGVANPNIGFICQLMQWHKRCHEDALQPRMYRIGPQSSAAPHYLVPKASIALDPRGVFVLHAGQTIWIWHGSLCIHDEAFSAAANRFGQQLLTYEASEAQIIDISQGEESEEFLKFLEKSRNSSHAQSVFSESGHPVFNERPIPCYDRDYDLYRKYISPPSSASDAGFDSARSGRKTPRFESSRAVSPNDRLRKQARSGSREEFERFGRNLTDGLGSARGLGNESARARLLEFDECSNRQIASPRLAANLGQVQNSFPKRDEAVGLTPRGESFASRRTSRFAVPELSLNPVERVEDNALPANPPDIDDKVNSSWTDSVDCSSASDSEPASNLSEKTVDDSTPRSDTTSHDRLEEEPDDGPGSSVGDAKRAAPPGVPRLNLGKGI